MAFLKAIWRGNSKHKKLCDEWILAGGKDGEAELPTDGITFMVKYLGSSLIETPSNEEATAEAIKTIITMAKASGKKLQRVALSVSLRGIKIVDMASQDTHLEVSIYRISYCSADAAHDHVFAFIATNANETMECHAFLCPKRKMAQAVTLTVAQSFNTAYELWQLSEEDSRFHNKLNSHNIQMEKIPDFHSKRNASSPEKQNINDSSPLLIDISTDSDPFGDNGNSWVSFDDDRTGFAENSLTRLGGVERPTASTPQQHLHILTSSSNQTTESSPWGDTHSINLLCS